MKVTHNAFEPLPKNPKAKRIRKKKPKIYWDAFNAVPPKAGKKDKKK